MTKPRRNISEAAALKALAHPLRMDLLGALQINGPMTATQLAAELDDSPSNCSWHLRKLAEHGFVAEIAGSKGRSRPWQAVSESLSWPEWAEEPETTVAGNELTDLLLTRELQRLREARQPGRLSREWREATTVVQSVLWLTAEEAKELSDRMNELLMTHFDRLRHPQRRPEGARLVSMVGWLAPRPDKRATGTDVPEDDEGPGEGR